MSAAAPTTARLSGGEGAGVLKRFCVCVYIYYHYYHEGPFLHRFRAGDSRGW